MNNAEQKELEYQKEYADWIWFKEVSYLFRTQDVEKLCGITAWGLQGALARNTKRFGSSKKLSVLRKKLTKI